MASSSSDQGTDHFDRLPDPLLLLVLNNVADVKALGRCSAVSRRFHSLVSLVHHILLRVDCVLSDDDTTTAASAVAAATRSRHTAISGLLRLVSRAFSQLFVFASSPFSSPRSCRDDGDGGGAVTHHSPAQVLSRFSDIRSLRIELPGGELRVADGVLLKWRAQFGSTIHSCTIIAASSISRTAPAAAGKRAGEHAQEEEGCIPDSFYHNGGLKLRMLWIISSLMAASARHYLLEPIVSEHKKMERLVLADCEGQGVVSMNRDQLEEMKEKKPPSAASAAKRTLVPALNLRLWYAAELTLPGGLVMEGATLVAIKPAETEGDEEEQGKEEFSPERDWFVEETEEGEEPLGVAAEMLAKRRAYYLQINPF